MTDRQMSSALYLKDALLRTGKKLPEQASKMLSTLIAEVKGYQKRVAELEAALSNLLASLDEAKYGFDGMTSASADLVESMCHHAATVLKGE